MSKKQYVLLFYDTEATSNSPREDHIISIGSVFALISSDGKFTDPQEFHTYVHTDRPIDPCAEAIHHIHSSDLIGKPKFPEAIEKWKNWILDCLSRCPPETELMIGGHNSDKFDGQILFCNFRYHKMNYMQFIKDIRWTFTFDSLTLLRKIFKTRVNETPKCKATGRRSFKLGDCYETFVGKPLLGAHNALTDARAVYDIFATSRMCEFYNVKSFLNSSKPIALYNRDILKTCGVAHEMIALTDPLDVPDTLTEEPIFDDDVNDTGMRLCINCMNFVEFQEHDTCFVPTMRK